jgi:Transposase DDE domain
MQPSEIMTLLILFHQPRHRDFKTFYTPFVCTHLKHEFPSLPSYTRFVEWMPRCALPLTAYLFTCLGKCSGISVVDSTARQVCHNRRIRAHRVFAGRAVRGRTSVDWFFGFKLHLIFNYSGWEGKGSRVLEYSHTLLKAALKWAVRWRLISSNPCDSVTRPPRANPQKRVWTRAETARFLEVVREESLYAAYLIYLLTGLRRSEVLGLRWQAIDFAARTLEVSHTIVYTNGARLACDQTKSKTSQRKFRISTELVDA